MPAARSRAIAGLLGPTLIALSLSELVNDVIWADNTGPATYRSGTLWFAAGLAILRAHNVWVRGRPVAVTLVGWFAPCR